MEKEKTIYYKLDGGGFLRRTGLTVEYLSQDGKWIQNQNLVSKFLGGDSDYEEISYEEALEAQESRKLKK